MTASNLLRRGSRGEDVRRLQQELQGAGCDPRGIDGIFGGGTEAAVKQLQSRCGLPADGIVGPLTWRALEGSARPAGPPPGGGGGGGGGAPAGGGLSSAGADFIARYEGCRLGLYDDPAGNCTIGIGHLVHKGPSNGSEPDEFRRGITRERALEILQQDAQSAARAVLGAVSVPLTQNELDALISFTFNVGAGNFRSSTLLKRLNAGDRGAVPGELGRWAKAGGRQLPGLVARRAAEGRLFATGAYR